MKIKTGSALPILENDLFRTAFEFSLNDMSMIDLDGRCDVNHSVCRITGYSKEELPGWSFLN